MIRYSKDCWGTKHISITLSRRLRYCILYFGTTMLGKMEGLKLLVLKEDKNGLSKVFKISQ